MDDSQTLAWILFAAFVITNFILYGFSYALQNLNEMDLEHDIAEGSKNAAKLFKLKSKPVKLVHTIQFLTIGLAAAVGYFQFPLFGEEVYRAVAKYENGFLSLGILRVLAFFVVGSGLILLLIILGNLLPKRLGRRYAKQLSNALLGICSFLMFILTPLTRLTQLLSSLLLWLVGINPDTDSENVTEKEIISMVNEGQEQGVIEDDEAEMITNIFKLNDKEAQDIMTNRANVIAFSGELTLEETVDLILDGNYTRLPVYGEDLDDIIGVLNFRDIMIEYNRKENNDKSIKDIPGLLREPYFITETRNIDILFKDMQSEKMHLAIVVDEYGQLSGIISMEDVLEEIVGNILDEYDEEETNIVTFRENVYMIKGMTTLEEIEESLGICYNEEDYDTLNGYLISKIGHIPNEHEMLEIQEDNLVYRIKSIENKMISLVELTMLPVEPKSNEDEADKIKGEF